MKCTRDGWSKTNFLQGGNAIFGGGEGDGWNSMAFLHAGNSIFTGGAGDGWVGMYRPLGVLPVRFAEFMMQKQAATSLLKWQTASEINSASFDVERSDDAIHFSKIGNVPAAGNRSVFRHYTFVDTQPLNGYNYYRLRQLDRNGSFVYTPVRMVSFNEALLQAVKTYPVPTTALLTVELPVSLRTQDVILNLSKALGIMVQQVRLPRNRVDDKRILNLPNLPTGVYTLQVVANGFNGARTVVKQ